MMHRSPTITFLILFLSARTALCHDLPVSYVDLRVNEAGVAATMETSAKNLERELPNTTEAALLADPTASTKGLAAFVSERLGINADGETLRPELRAIEALAGRRDLRLQSFHASKRPNETISVRCFLFPSDAKHKTFVNVYRQETLKFQEIFGQGSETHSYVLSEHQNVSAVIAQAVREGVHHIFIGPDHILFVVGLLLLGGTIGQLLKVVTAFTIAHSVTLVLATLNILSPPARVIEPAIALSIIFVGAHALLFRTERRDWRLLFAFGFGFIHGFGFANVLRAMQLPRAAGRSFPSMPVLKSARRASFSRSRRWLAL